MRSSRTVATFVGGALVLGVTLFLVDLLAVDVFLVLFIPFVVLVLAHLRRVLHWTAFSLIAAATGITLLRIHESESSTAGFGVIVVPLLLTTALLLAALVDRLVAARSRRTSQHV